MRSDTIQTCPLCEADETMPAKDQEKRWQAAEDLAAHMKDKVHSQYAQFCRRARLGALAHNQFLCPYCVSGEVQTTFSTLSRLVKHVEDSNTGNTTQEHDDAKTAAGWYTEDFYGTIGAELVTARRRRSREAHELNFTWHPSLDFSVPHPTDPALMLGAFGGIDDLPQRLRDQMITGAEAAARSPPPPHPGVRQFDPEIDGPNGENLLT